MSRTRWMIVGLGVGAAAQRKADRALRRRLEALAPEHLLSQGRDRLSQQMQTARASIGDAIDEGRAVMQQRESDLRGGPQDGPDVIDLVPRVQPKRADDPQGLRGSAFERIPPAVPRGRRGRQTTR